jgi:micrococcal nuclease
MGKTDYYYEAIVVSVYDGDTIRFDIDLGFNMWIKNESVRLRGIDAPEIRGEERPIGLQSRDWVRSQLPRGSKVLIRTEKPFREKYGRYLATVFLSDGTNLNEMMVNLGFAEKYS